MRLTRKHRKFTGWWFLGGIILLALLLRVVHLSDRSLWFDEAFSWRLIQFPPFEFLSRAAADVHPILYYVVLWFWTRPTVLLGQPLTLGVLRSLSVVLSAATIASTFFAGSFLYRSRTIGLTAALLLAVNAFHLQYAWEARMYALGTFLLPLASVALFRAIRSRTPRAAWGSAILLGLAAGALLHVHYYALFSVAALGIFTVGLAATALWRSHARAIRNPATWAPLAGLIVAGTIFTPWLPVFLRQFSTVQTSYWIPPPNAWSIPNTMARLLLGGTSDISPAVALVSTTVVLLLVTIPLLRGRTMADVFLALLVLVPFAGSWWLSQRTSIYLDRYFVFVSVPLVLLAARTLSFLPRTPRRLATAVVALIGLWTITALWQELDFPSHPGANAVAESLKRDARPGEPIVVSSSFVYFPLAFHLGCTRTRPTCDNGLSVHLYSESGALSHFAGGPILVPSDVVGPEVFQADRLTIVDTTGFGGSRLEPPRGFVNVGETYEDELFPYQGTIIARYYVRQEVVPGGHSVTVPTFTRPDTPDGRTRTPP